MSYSATSRNLLNWKFRVFLRVTCSVLLASAISGCEVMYGVVLMASCGFSSDLEIHPETLPAAIVGQPYRVDISASGKQAPIGEFYLSYGQLPVGLEFVFFDNSSGESTAAIEGVPSETGNFPIAVGARTYGTHCAGQTANNEYALEVTDK
ncbi:hypothetical protein [Marinobacter xestospongiae]|uniref:Ig-like domain-containing protein n=1 Tax=Marinobacter xestospongiae TaxID=994319 RepID=A0ABU3VUS2_9GAMM|nr:hypothetical protein [Marinobacter xestospongiae]MDV2078027.1 hypothetical protein [Marinobacter xestospongiae]